jgi:hypothetical protein
MLFAGCKSFFGYFNKIHFFKLKKGFNNIAIFTGSLVPPEIANFAAKLQLFSVTTNSLPHFSFAFPRKIPNFAS